MCESLEDAFQGASFAFLSDGDHFGIKAALQSLETEIAKKHVVEQLGTDFLQQQM